ncbi:hypothetical protein D2E98_07375 [Mycobacteroides abscessus]|uniref:hypothetical protein n=1 Tax=Mycobacteroides abscessus TaxID=36809 RepID=UPI000D3E63E3|nr:hypothetical protein [Mycobacteroides abscessus]PVB05073.1 hypothetical protein DDJ47_07550 [Mycobacteroides abscessus]RIT46055.1 hypothetical protein D2E98_07375 [Mycobacteroides abscessus]
MFELAELDREGGLFIAGDIAGYRAVHRQICPFEPLSPHFFNAPVKQCQFLVSVGAVSGQVVGKTVADRLNGRCR